LGLELVADVGHEVTPDLFESPPFRDVLDHRDHAERPPTVVDEPGPDGECAPRRSIQIEAALGLTFVPGVL